MSERGKVLVTGSSVDDHHLDSLRSAGFAVHAVHELLDEEALADELEDCTAYLLGGDEYASRNVLSKASNLKVVAVYGVGYTSFVDVDAARELGIPVTNTAGASSDSVAEFTLGLLLAQRRQILTYAFYFRNESLGTEQKQRDIAGHNLGIIGLGGIGTRIAEIATAGFNAQVSYYAQTRKVSLESRLGLTYRPIHELLPWAESVVLMVPETSETRGMIGLEQVKLLAQEDVCLVNTARPRIVDPAALLFGLETGRIATAAFDGFYDMDDGLTHELLKFPQSRLLVTGHIASHTHDASRVMTERCIQSILNVTSGAYDKYVVNEL